MLNKIIVTRTGGYPSNIQLSGDIKGLRQSLKDELGIISADTADVVIPFTKATAYILLCYQKKFPNDIDIQDDIIIEYGKKTTDPTTYLISDPYKQRKYLIVELPSFVPSYTSLAFQARLCWSKEIKKKYLPFHRIYTGLMLLKNFHHDFLPSISIGVTCPIDNNKYIVAHSLSELRGYGLDTLQMYNYAYNLNNKRLAEFKINDVLDLLLYKPNKYKVIDFSKAVDIKDAVLNSEEAIVVKAKYRSMSYRVTRNTNIDINIIQLVSTYDNCETVYSIPCFGNTRFFESLKVNDPITFTCKNKYMSGPTRLVAGVDILPVYPYSRNNGINEEFINNTLLETLFLMKEGGGYNIDYLDVNFYDILKRLHFPTDKAEAKDANSAMAQLELFYLKMLLEEEQGTDENKKGISKGDKSDLTKLAIMSLPYDLTTGQKKAFIKIVKLLKSDKRGQILLSGDVGSGKTVLANMASVYAVENGYQVVYLAPTNILAEQLYKSIQAFVEPLNRKIKVEFMNQHRVGKSEKQLQERINSGDVDIIVGTHGVSNYNIPKLGLLIIDEQQKFGVNVKEKLVKPNGQGVYPDVLMMTATPIPSTIAKVFYGSSQLIQLKDKPVERVKIISQCLESDDSLHALEQLKDKMSEELAKGNQIYVVANLVVDDKIDGEEDIGDNVVIKRHTVKEAVDKLKQIFPNENVLGIHGKLKQETQDRIMQKFRRKEGNILVGSTILEVGIDIRDATMMIILDADRYGVATLHQLRGRVGRGNKESYCYFVYDQIANEGAKERLAMICNEDDGFKLALNDLQERKEGDITGTMQHGYIRGRYCTLQNFTKYLPQVEEDIKRVYATGNRQKALQDARAYFSLPISDNEELTQHS